MYLPGLRLHRLKDANAGIWAVTVRPRQLAGDLLEDGHAADVDYLDYH